MRHTIYYFDALERVLTPHQWQPPPTVLLYANLFLM